MEIPPLTTGRLSENSAAKEPFTRFGRATSAVSACFGVASDGHPAVVRNQGGRGVSSQDMTLPEAMVKTLDHFAPEFWQALARVKDPRHPLMLAYPIEMELLVALLMFITKLGSRRNIKYKLGTPAFAANLQNLCTPLYPKTWRPFPDSVPHGDTPNYLLKGVAPREIHVLRRLIIRSLIRKRALEGFRLLGRCCPVAMDGTGQLVFNEKHCERCIHKTHDGQTVYYHPVVEAKPALENGLALSVGTAFMENVAPAAKKAATKQDCELKGFYRLAKELKADFPLLDICLLLNGLFANGPVIRLCKRNRWAYIIAFKEGSLPAVWQGVPGAQDARSQGRAGRQRAGLPADVPLGQRHRPGRPERERLRVPGGNPAGDHAVRVADRLHAHCGECGGTGGRRPATMED
jgi:hypothetical protein